MRLGLLTGMLLFSATGWAIPEGPGEQTPEWGQREEANYARVSEAPAEQASNPVFMQRLTEQSLANTQFYAERSAADPSWNLSSASNTPLTPLCATWSEQCAGDPFRYPGVDPFYETEGEIQPFVYYDEGCARIAGRVWKPLGASTKLPAVVIETGSVQSPEPLYWWLAQLLVRNGYVVMTFDVRGQGRSDQQTPTGEQGSNANPTVFWDGLVNAIDFFRSSPVQPYPHNQTCAGTYPTEVAAFNPFHAVVDPARLGLAGHSLGATGVSVVQGLGGEGADPWPGLIDAQNPVDVIVAWDSLRDPDDDSQGEDVTPVFVPRVPAMGHSSEYGLTPVPFTQAPDPEGHKSAFAAWQAADVPAYQLTIQGSSHYEWSNISSFPTTSWCPEVVDGQCVGGWGLPMAEHYTLAWFDRWLKQVGEPGFATADARLTADTDWVERMSFYFRSARDYPSRAGQPLHCEDIRGGIVDGAPCAVASGSKAQGGGKPSGSGRAGGGCALVDEPAGLDPVLALLALTAMLGIRRRFRAVRRIRKLEGKNNG